MIGLKCFSISYSYMEDADITLLLTDIETGCMAALYAPDITDLDLRSDIQHMLVAYAENSDTLPQTFLFFGDYEYGEDTIFLHIYDEVLCGILPYKLCACYIDRNFKANTFNFVDRLTGTVIALNDVPVSVIQDIGNFVNCTITDRYHGFDYDGDDSVIIGGNISNLDNDMLFFSFDEATLLGVKSEIYNRLFQTMINGLEQ